ncbi:hypothetical protein [Singulisphaera sp. PoT]|uniref:hypothetical protein n=1 Tax=Singulisphaera sp. PoT TaxID=3411797 RepID=UPI003BF478DA
MEPALRPEIHAALMRAEKHRDIAKYGHWNQSRGRLRAKHLIKAQKHMARAARYGAA